MKLEAGVLIGSGKYKLMTCLGHGGQAEVWEAEQQGHGGFTKQVVLKIVTPGRRGDPQLYQNLLREAQLSSLLHHPNVAEVYDVGEEDSLLYIAMERIDGRDLERILKRSKGLKGKPLPWHLAAYIVSHVCEGLQHVHNKKDDDGKPLDLVHRDLKPSNILLSVDGFIKVIDFGVAKAATTTQVTQKGAVRGTPAYMAPEQIRSLPVDARSDLFSLGTVLYELCTGQRAFQEEDLYALFFAVLSKVPTAPRRLNEDIPSELEQVILRAMAKSPMTRFQNAAEMQKALREVLHKHDEHPTQSELAELYAELVEKDKPISLGEHGPAHQHRTMTYGVGTAVSPESQEEPVLAPLLEPLKAPTAAPAKDEAPSQAKKQPARSKGPTANKQPEVALPPPPTARWLVKEKEETTVDTLMPLPDPEPEEEGPRPSFDKAFEVSTQKIELAPPSPFDGGFDFEDQVTQHDRAEPLKIPPPPQLEHTQETEAIDEKTVDVQVPVPAPKLNDTQPIAPPRREEEPLTPSFFFAEVGGEDPNVAFRSPFPASDSDVFGGFGQGEEPSTELPSLFPESSFPFSGATFGLDDDRRRIVLFTGAGVIFLVFSLFVFFKDDGDANKPKPAVQARKAPSRKRMASWQTFQVGRDQPRRGKTIAARGLPPRTPPRPQPPVPDVLSLKIPDEPPKKRPPPRARKKKRKRRRRRRKRGRVRFRIQPACTLYKGRRRLGSSRTYILRRRAGRYRLKCINRRLRLYKSFRVRVRGGRTTTYRRRFRRGVLFVVSYPWVAIHLRPFGKIGFSQDRIPLWTGRYRLYLYRKGNRRFRKTLRVRIRAGRITKPRVVRW